ncbi:MAG: PEP-utilizing enzyme [archaeon]
MERFVPGYGLQVILTFFQEEGDRGNWVEDEDELLRTGRQIEEHPKVVDQAISLWTKKKSAYYEFIRKLETDGIKNLQKDYRKFRNLYFEEYSVALFTESFIPWSDVMIGKIMKEYPKEAYKDIEFMVLPLNKTFMLEEEESSLRIARELRIRDVKALRVAKDDPEVYHMLQEHQKRFFWIENNYKNTEPITEEEFFRRIISIELGLSRMDEKIEYLSNYSQQTGMHRKELIKKWMISKVHQRKLELISRMSWFHDRRKKANLIGNFWINEFLKKASEKYKVDIIDLQHTLPDEFEDMLERGKCEMPEIAARKEGCVLINDISGRSWMLVGKDFNQLKHAILDAKSPGNISDFRGARACPGLVRGRARVILDPKNGTIEKGEILIAPMTRPEYVPLMRRAAGVVTDEGGVISHAAIISRELGIPCVVGTKIATKVLKTGMHIELNANHGVVRIL